MQTIYQYAGEFVSDFLAFVAFWEARAAEDPETWPLSMGAGEWHEQFLSWTETAPSDKM